MELEGCLGLYPGAGGPRLVLSVRSYAQACVDAFAKDLGIGSVGPTKNSTYATWGAHGKEAQALLAVALPYFVCKRAQAQALVEYPIAATRGTQLTTAQKAERLRLEALVCKLNEKGPKEPRLDWTGHAQDWIDWAKRAPLTERADLLAWAIEWEGTIHVREKSTAGAARGVSHGVGIGVVQSEHRRCLLEIIQALAGGVGSIGSTGRMVSLPGHAKMLSWWESRIRETKELVGALVPYLSCKRRLAELVVAFPEGPAPPVRTPLEVFKLRERLAEESKRINAKVGATPERSGLTPAQTKAIL